MRESFYLLLCNNHRSESIRQVHTKERILSGCKEKEAGSLEAILVASYHRMCQVKPWPKRRHKQDVHRLVRFLQAKTDENEQLDILQRKKIFFSICVIKSFSFVLHFCCNSDFICVKYISNLEIIIEISHKNLKYPGKSIIEMVFAISSYVTT